MESSGVLSARDVARWVGRHSPRGDAQGRGYFRQRHPQEVVQGDDGSMARIQAPKRHVQALALGERDGVIGHVEGIDGRKLDLDGAPPAAPDEIKTGVDGEAV